MRVWSCVLIVSAALAQGSHAAPPLPSAEQTLVAPNGLTATCMARTTTKQDGHDWDFVVPVPADKQAEFTGKGFQPAACARMLVQLAQHKAFVCDLALGNETVQYRMQQIFGVDAVKLCSVARLLLPEGSDSPTAMATNSQNETTVIR